MQGCRLRVFDSSPNGVSLHAVAHGREHGKTAVLDFLDLPLSKGIRIRGHPQGSKAPLGYKGSAPADPRGPPATRETSMAPIATFSKARTATVDWSP